MDLVRNLTGLIHAPYSRGGGDHRLIVWVFPSLYVLTDLYVPYGTRRIHLRVIVSMWPKYTRTPIDRLYSSDRKKVISYVDFPQATVVRPSLQASLINRRFEAYLHTCSSMCKRPLNELYQKLYISSTPFPTVIRIKGQKLATCNSRLFSDLLGKC